MPTRSDAGRRWLTKALHPAEASIKAPKAPGSSRYPTTVQEVTSTFVLNPPSGIASTDTWEFRIVTHTDPLCPMEFYSNITGSTEAFHGSYFNQAFFKTSDSFKVHTQPEAAAIFAAFQSACETYRINALSTTGIFVGPTIADQGSILSSQFIDCARDMAMAPGSPVHDILPLANIWVDPLPAMSEAALGQRPYVSDAREGWYSPQKMEQPGHWARVNDVARRGRYIGSTVNPGEMDLTDCVPWPALYGAAAGTLFLWPRCYDNSCSQTFVKGLSPQTSFRVTLRMVIEMGVTPNNDYAAFATDPAPPDPVAYELYMSIVNELLDAYPADYNDAGKIWGKIKAVAKKVAGFIDPIAGIAAAAGVPFAKTVQGIARGVSGGKAIEYIDAEKDGLASAIDALKAEKKDIVYRALSKKTLSKQAKAAAAKASLVISPKQAARLQKAAAAIKAEAQRRVAAKKAAASGPIPI